MPLLLVATVRCLRARDCASSNAYLSTRSAPMAREHRLLDHELALGAREHHAAEVRVLALGVLAHDEVVDVAGLAARQRAGHAFEQAHRAQVDVLVELAPELQQRAPQRDVVGHRRGPADGAEVDRVDACELLLPVVGHHLAVLRVVVAARPLDVRGIRARSRSARRRRSARAGLRASLPCRCRRRRWRDAERGVHVVAFLKLPAAGLCRSSSSSQPRRSSGTARASCS